MEAENVSSQNPVTSPKEQEFSERELAVQAQLQWLGLLIRLVAQSLQENKQEAPSS